MKCIYCGKELEEDSMFCSHCGKEVQIVPDYSVYDDDYLKAVLTEDAAPEAKKPNTSAAPGPVASKPQEQAEEEVPPKTKSQKKKRNIIIASVSAALVVLIVILLVVNAQIQKSHDNSFDYQLSLAQKAYDSGNLNDAITYYEKALALDKDNLDVRLALADICMQKKDYDSALVLYQEIIQKDNKNKEACEKLIAIYEEQKNTDAILALSEAVDDNLKDLFSDYMVTPPAFSIDGGTYDSMQTLTLSSSGNYRIYYTTDGSDPIEKGLIYMSPIELKDHDTTYVIKAVCRNDKQVYSDVISKEYTINIPAPDMPIVTPDGGNFGVETTVTVTVPSGCVAYYTWDGSNPVNSGEEYTGPITIPEGNNVLSVVLFDKETNLSSDVFRGNYVYYSEDYSDEDSAENDQ